MPEGGNNRAVVVKSSKNLPNHTQYTNIMHARHPEGGKDEMCVAKGQPKVYNHGEKSVLKYRTPY